MLSHPAPSPVARAIARGEIRGTLRAAAWLPGALGIPIAGCQLSLGGPSSLVIQYTPGPLRIDGRRRTVTRMLTAVRFGAGESHALRARLQFSLHTASRAYTWTSMTGRLHWADGLRSGSFTATLRPSGGAARAPIRLSGTWRRCATSATA